MTRSSKVTLVTLLVGLLSLAAVGTVSAETSCTGVMREHCEQMATEQALSFHIAAASQTNDTPYVGVAREQAEARFLENNTTNLPNAVAADVRPVITSQQQKLLEVNTTMMPTAVDAP